MSVNSVNKGKFKDSGTEWNLSSIRESSLLPKSTKKK